MKSRWGTSFWVVSFCLCASTGFTQMMLLEDCNDATLAPGFVTAVNTGDIVPNQTDNQTWAFYGATSAWGDWNAWAVDSITTPDFKASAFTVKYAVGNVFRTSHSEWDNIVLRIGGLEKDLVIYFGSSAANGEIKPDYALYMEVQHADKANGYIWDSKNNLGGQEVPAPWSDYIDEFPGKSEIEIVFRGPNQPIDIYFNFDGKGRTHLLQWDDQEPANTFANVLGKDTTDTYSVTLRPNAGSLPVFSFDLDYLKIAGDIESEYAVKDPDFTQVENWQLY